MSNKILLIIWIGFWIWISFFAEYSLTQPIYKRIFVFLLGGGYATWILIKGVKSGNFFDADDIDDFDGGE